MPSDPGSVSEKRTPAPRDRRTITVLFADVAGSTAMIERIDPEQAWAMLDPVLDVAADIIKRYEGTVTKRLGDGLMAMFGAPIMLEDHALRACRCALEVQAALRRRAASPAGKAGAGTHMRIGIHSGPVVVTEAIEDMRTVFDAVGATVVLASRIQSEAVPGSVFVSESTFRAVRSAFACRAAGARRLKGFAQPQPVYELLREGPDAEAQPPPGGHHIAAPLIGRDRPLATVMRAFDRLSAGSGGLLLVVGEAGVGKSRLIEEARHASKGAVLWLEGHSMTFTERISYWPYIQLLRPVLSLSDGAANAENWQGLQASLAELFGAAAETEAPYIATLLGLEPPHEAQERLRRLEGEVLRAQIFRAARQLFDRLAGRQPLVLVIEDMQWADGSSRALLDHLLPLAGARPILFIAICRPDPQRLAPLKETAQKELPGRFEEIELQPLSVEESGRLLISILGDGERMARLRDRILYKAEGNPFFLEEVVRQLIDSGVLVLNEGRREWTVQNQDFVLPQTIESLVMARIDRLDQRLREVLGIAAVVGRTFLYRVLRAVTAVEIDEPLMRLTAVELIERHASAPEPAYLFRHAVTHETVYENILVDQRRQLHARVAACLGEIYADRPHEGASLLAFHHARAGNWHQSLPYLLDAAEQSSRMAADTEALALCEDALASYARTAEGKADRTQRARIEWRLGEIHFRRGGAGRAEEHFVRALEAMDERMPASRMALAMAIAREFVHHVAMMLMRVGMTPPIVAARDPADEVRIGPYEALGWIYFLSDQSRLVYVILRSANLAQRIRDCESISKTYSGLGLGLTMRGLHRLAHHYHRTAVAVAERYADASSRTFAQDLFGVHLFMRGRWAEAEAAFADARARADRIGDLLVWSDAAVLSCELWNETAEFEQALALARTMIARGREAAFQPAIRWGLGAEGKALRRSGHVGESHPVLDEAFRLALANNDMIAATACGGDLALSLAALGRIDEAERTIAGLRQRIDACHIRIYTICGVYAADTELAMRRFEAGASAASALRSHAAAKRASRIFPVGVPAALRLEGRFQLLSGRPARARRAWDRAAAAAEALGARYELALVERERSRL